LYFAATDTDLDYLDSSAISAEFVNRQMGRSRSGRKILLLDCCYSGAFAPSLGARAGKGVDLKERFGQGQVVLTASSSMEYAFEGNALTGTGNPSFFTSAVVQGLQSGDADGDGDGEVSMSELFNYVTDEVRRFTSKQNPLMWNYGLRGEIMIAHRARKPVTERPSGPPQPPLVGTSVNLARWVHTDPSEESQPVGVLAMEAALAYHGRWIRLDRNDFWRKLRERASQIIPIKPNDTTISYRQKDLIATLTNDGVASSDGTLFRARATRLRTAQDILSALNRGSPMLSGLSVPEAMLSQEVSTFGQLPDNWSTNPILGGTTIGIFGYDTDKRRWLILTGWPSWGVGGFGWIPAEDVTAAFHADSFGIEVPVPGSSPVKSSERVSG